MSRFRGLPSHLHFLIHLVPCSGISSLISECYPIVTWLGWCLFPVYTSVARFLRATVYIFYPPTAFRGHMPSDHSTHLSSCCPYPDYSPLAQFLRARIGQNFFPTQYMLVSRLTYTSRFGPGRAEIIVLLFLHVFVFINIVFLFYCT